MQFLLSVLDDGTGRATPTEDAAIDVFNQQLQDDGRWVFAGGLGDPAPAVVVDHRGDGAAVVTDGPFLESKEYVAGFWIIEAASVEEARELAAAGSKACHRRVELRPFL